MADNGAQNTQMSREDRELLDRLLSQMRDTEYEFYEDLIDRVEAETYPSQNLLDMIEENLPPELYPDYVQVLVDKLRRTRYPSMTMLRRVQRLISQTAG